MHTFFMQFTVLNFELTHSVYISIILCEICCMCIASIIHLYKGVFYIPMAMGNFDSPNNQNLSIELL